MSRQHDPFKIGIVGCGKVGMTTAYALLLKGVPSELVLIGRKQAEVEGEQLDLEHGMSFMEGTVVTSSTEYSALQGCDLVFFTAGAAQAEGETRLDLAAKNKAIVAELIPQIVQNAPDAVIVMVTNPVDVLTFHASQIANKPFGQVFGSGTLLDTSRFRFHLSEFLNLNPRSIHTYILGEHGDSSFPVIHGASVGGQSLSTLEGFTYERAMEAYQMARDAAYKVIQGKGATYYAIGTVLAHIAKAIKQDARSVMPVSVPLENYYGHSGVSFSVPCIVGRGGVVRPLQIELSEQEQQQLSNSVQTIRQYL